MGSKTCFSCRSDIKRIDKCVNCFVCEKCFHTKCLGMSSHEEKAIHDWRGIKYVCATCENSKVQVQLDTLNKKLEECFNMILKQSEVINQMDLIMQSMVKGENITRSKSYSKVLNNKNEVLLIKPKDDKQKCEQTHQDLKMKINPSKLAVAVDTVKNIRNGGVAINLNNSSSKEILKKSVTKELGNQYEVIEAVARNPKVIIVGIESDTLDQEDDDILRSICEQNELKLINGKELQGIKIKRKFLSKNKKYGNIVMEVEGEIYKILIKKEKINIGWKKCNVYEYDNIIRCYKCGAFNHMAKECKNEESCSKCAGPHKTTQCTAKESKCINCIHANQKLRMNLNINHMAQDRECPCYKRIVEKLRSKVNYQ